MSISPFSSPLRPLLRLGALALLATLTISPAIRAQQDVEVPVLDVNLPVMELRAWLQQKTLDRFEVFHDFTFQDMRSRSGIRFENKIVDDGGRSYKAVHYDHGNGIAVADVNGDDLLDIYFTTQIGPNELYLGRGNGRFREITDLAGVDLVDRISVTASFADIDNDGDQDLFVTTVKMGNVLFENDGEGKFRDITESAGVGHIGHSSGSVFFDYDLDGLLDLFVTNVGQYTGDEKGPGDYYIGFKDAFSGHLYPERTETSILYRNLGGNRFQDVSQEMGLVDGSWSGDASFTDLNGDRYPDLYVLNMQGDDHYYENVEGKRFVDRSEEMFPRTPWGAMGIKFFDWDNDGLQDLILTDMHSDMSQEVTPGYEKLKSMMVWEEDHLQGGDNNIFGNAFYSNRGDGKFEEVSDRVGAENFWPWGLSVGDLNADGYLDIFIASSMNFPFRYGINTALLNNNGKVFLDSEFILGLEPRSTPAKKPWFDLDCSGSDQGHAQCKGKSGAITVWASRGTRSSVIVDIDGDGDVDIVTNEFNDSPQVLVSNLSERTQVHFIEVALQGKESNRNGLGATVEVHVGDKVYTRYHDGKSGYLSQSVMPLYFGLGDAKAVDRIEILWPSGRSQKVSEGLEVNRRITIVEG